MNQQPTNRPEPDVSLVMPCFNEEAAVGSTIPKLVLAHRIRGHRLELVAVDNGSFDATGQRLAELARRYEEVVVHRVEVNQGYGHGVLSGFARASAPLVGTIAADGQVDPEDVVRLFEAVRAAGGQAVGKVRRRFRMDGPIRKVVSIGYNVLARLLWPRLGTLDVNGIPKLLPREALVAMRLESKGWLLDPEIMVKSRALGLRVIELNVFARMRGTGLSHVRPVTCWEFLSHMLAARLGGRWNLRSTEARLARSSLPTSTVGTR